MLLFFPSENFPPWSLSHIPSPVPALCAAPSLSDVTKQCSGAARARGQGILAAVCKQRHWGNAAQSSMGTWLWVCDQLQGGSAEGSSSQGPWCSVSAPGIASTALHSQERACSLPLRSDFAPWMHLWKNQLGHNAAVCSSAWRAGLGWSTGSSLRPCLRLWLSTQPKPLVPCRGRELHSRIWVW